MSDIQVPHAIQAVLDAINSGDIDAFVAAFTPTGSIDDWGRVLSGAEGVRRWGNSDAIGAGATITVLKADTDGDVTTLFFDWRSRVFNGTSHAIVTVSGDKVSSFRIPAKH